MKCGENMIISYNKLWELMIEKTNRRQLCKKNNSSTREKLINEKKTTLLVMRKNCVKLESNVCNILEFIDLDDVKKKIYENLMDLTNRENEKEIMRRGIHE